VNEVSRESEAVSESGIAGLWRRAPWATVGAAAYALAYALFMQLGAGSPAARDLVSELAFLPFNAAVLGLALLASGREELHPRVRRALRLIALASLLVLCGNLLSLGYKLFRHESPAVSPADAFYLADYLVLLAALLSFPRVRHAPHERWQFALDAAMVLLGAGVAIWFFVVWPGMESGRDDLARTALAYAYPLASLLLLYGLTTVMLQRPADGNRTAFALLAGGILLSIVADLTFGLIQLEVGRRGMAWTDAVYLVVYVGLVSSMEVYWRWPVRPPPARTDEAGPAPVSPLPYVTVAITYGLLFVTALTLWTTPLSGLAVGAVAITLLVLGRQYLAVRQNVRLMAQAAERRTEARFRTLVQHSSDVILVVLPDGLVRFVSPAVHRVFGYDAARLIGGNLLDLVHPEDRDLVRTFLRDTARTPGVTPPLEWRVRRPDGSWSFAETTGNNLLDDPTVSGIVLNSRDVTERKRLEQQLTHQAFHDSLTGLANRALFRDRVAHALLLAQRARRDLGVIFLDLDDFKRVNDSLGHSQGDQLLMQVAGRLQAAARATDTVARLGGDEFAVLVENVGGHDGCAQVIERLRNAMAEPFLVGGHAVNVRASMGVATSGGEDSADDLLRNADVAMYAAKRTGKGGYKQYDARLHAAAMAELETEAALRGAAERGELVLHYQPIYSLRTGRLFGVEALLRWAHPDQGLLLPAQFVPLAEENGLIVPLGRWVLREAFRQLRDWRARYPEAGVVVCVNISGRQLQVPTLGPEVREALKATGADPRTVILEITESVLMHQTEETLEELQRLKHLGFRLAIDDFGTGYSSLSYLQRFPIDLLKIARPFVEQIGLGRERAALARAIIGLGETLRLGTIAEGIEVTEQWAGLRELGCQYGQGYYFAPPLSAAEVERLLGEPTRHPIPSSDRLDPAEPQPGR
jgi:diguanylate cyclase (GGDEF)-like protein/PAS domain S-box-containing protein